jgi:hypothetical protein
MAINFLAIAQACRDAAAGRPNALPVDTYNTLLAEFYARGDAFTILTEAVAPMFAKLEEVSATEPRDVLQAVVETLRSRQKQPGPVCIAFRRFATVLELAHQIQEILHAVEPELDLPEMPSPSQDPETQDGGCIPTDETDIHVPDLRAGRTPNPSGSLHDS